MGSQHERDKSFARKTILKKKRKRRSLKRGEGYCMCGLVGQLDARDTILTSKVEWEGEELNYEGHRRSKPSGKPKLQS